MKNTIIKILGGYTNQEYIQMKQALLHNLEIERQKGFKKGEKVYIHDNDYSNNQSPLWIHKTRYGLQGDIVLELVTYDNIENGYNSLAYLAKFIKYEKPNNCNVPNTAV